MTTSTPETNDQGKGLFSDEDDDDLFASTTKQVKSPDTSSSGPAKKVNKCGIQRFKNELIITNSLN